MVFSPIEVNTYILAGRSGECAIIDCGCYTAEEFEKLSDFIKSKNLEPVLLLNTHCHLDHLFGNHFVFSSFGIKPRFHRLDEYNRIGSPQHAMRWGLVMDEPPAAGSYIEHGDIISSGSISLKALLVPGHTTGSLAFYSEQDACVFTGDALFAGSIGRSDLPGGDYLTLLDSIRNNLLTLPPDTVVYPGHGQETSVGREKMVNPYLA